MKIDEDQYRKEFVPMKASTNEKLKLNISFRIFKIEEINQANVSTARRFYVVSKNLLYHSIAAIHGPQIYC